MSNDAFDVEGAKVLDLELLQTLVCVVDERSFTRAGERVHRTQSTVSQQIRKLEERVGRPLLLRDRTGTQITPTAQGELLTNYARRLLALAQEAEEVPQHIGIVGCSAEGAALCYRTICQEGAKCWARTPIPRCRCTRLRWPTTWLAWTAATGGRRRADAGLGATSWRRPAPTS
jgi:molybdenum-dependent DNA-binding transcriptional regulator ModE